jgi:hypothetical protein
MRVRLAHALDHHRRHLGEERLLPAEQPAVPHGAPDDLAKDVAAPLVRRIHAVGEEERGGTRVVGDDLVAEALLFELLRVVSEELAHPGEDRHEQISVVVRGDLLEDARQPLEAQARVDTGERQRPAAVRALVELHEHEVPELEPARAVLAVVRDAVRALAQVRAPIEVDLAARAARPGLGHPPEVLVVALVDIPPLRHPLWREADLIAPHIPRDVVVRVRRRSKALGRDLEVAGEEIPGELDCLALEVVAEAEVAEHLEERVVARGPANLLEVVVLACDPEDTLVVGGPVVAPCLRAGEDILELDHPGVREQEGLVAGRDEARAGHDGVAALREELEEAAADLGSGQADDPRISFEARGPHRAQWYRTGPSDRGRPPDGL